VFGSSRDRPAHGRRPAIRYGYPQAICAHCAIEKQLHRVLDVLWVDASLNSDTVVARNMASLRKIALNLARLAQSRQPKKASHTNIHSLAAWNCEPARPHSRLCLTTTFTRKPWAPLGDGLK
jgi:hypothetical protein